MRARTTPIRIGLALASAAVIVSALALLYWVGVARAEETWQVTLRLQLQDERKCELQTYVSVRQLPDDKVGGIDGRVRCTDGREFDFTRKAAHQKFELALCQPAVC